LGFIMRADAHLSEIAGALQTEIYALCPSLGYPLIPRRKASRRNSTAA
jgi:hypothetical protein